MGALNLAEAYRGKRVFLTGHTGFKGSWLALWLARLGAQVTGYALAPPADGQGLYDAAGVDEGLASHIADVRDAAALEAALAAARPEIVFHLAAQPLVIDSYAAPAETFATNVTGTINLMEAVRRTGTTAALVMVTTDKVYRNREWVHAYREEDALGGHDPYSASKAAMEIALASWRASFFGPGSGVRMAAARAGNVIGGGDWAANRIVPDIVRAALAGRAPELRNPQALRPWQHVLDPLAGYLRLGALLMGEGGRAFAQGYNFGPAPHEVRSVGDLADALLARLGGPGWTRPERAPALHEATLLRLAIDKAVAELAWAPRWDFAETVARTANWYRSVAKGGDARAACLADIAAFESRYGAAEG